MDEDGCYMAAAGPELHRRPVLTEGDQRVLGLLGTCTEGTWDCEVRVQREPGTARYVYRGYLGLRGTCTDPYLGLLGMCTEGYLGLLGTCTEFTWYCEVRIQRVPGTARRVF